MATPSYYKSIPIALLVVFATVAPTVQQQVRADDDGAAKASAPRGPPIQPKGGMFSDFPCFPFLPKVLRDLCHALFYPSPQQPCRPVLKERLVSSCTGFLTNSSVQEPPSACCHDLMSLYSSSSSVFCFCHVANGNIGELLPAPLNRSRAIPVVSKCMGFDEDFVTNVCINHPYSYNVPPMDSTAPPPAPETKKA